MFVKRATLSRCMSLFQTVTCTSSVSDDNAFMHVLPSPAQGCRASLLQETLSCDPAMRLTTPSPDILSLFLPSSAYILSDSILSPFPSLHYCAHTQYPYSPHASRRWVWEPLEADKFNVESRDTHYKQEKKNLCKARRLEQESGLEFQWGWVGGQLQSFTNQNDMTALCGPRPVKRAPPWSLAAQYPNFLIVFYVQ